MSQSRGHRLGAVLAGDGTEREPLEKVVAAVTDRSARVVDRRGSPTGLVDEPRQALLEPRPVVGTFAAADSKTGTNADLPVASASRCLAA